MFVALGFQIAAEPKWQDFVSINTLAIRLCKVAGAVHINDAVNMAGLFRIATGSFELRHMSCYT